MKKEYVAPMMYSEEFVPNAYAAGCAPGIDESKVGAYVEKCYYLHSGWSGCSKEGTELYFFLEGNTACADVTLNKDGSTGTRGGIKIVDHDFEVRDGYFSGHYDEKPAYRWSNQNGGYHYIPVSELGGQINGKPKYFVS